MGSRDPPQHLASEVAKPLAARLLVSTPLAEPFPTPAQPQSENTEMNDNLLSKPGFGLALRIAGRLRAPPNRGAQTGGQRYTLALPEPPRQEADSPEGWIAAALGRCSQPRRAKK